MTTVVHPGDSLTTRQRMVYVIVLGALTALGPFTIDLYLPAFPVLERELAVSASAIQLTLTATMVGFGVGQLFVGPLSDKIGRKRPLVAATVVHVLASLGAALAPDYALLLVFRVLQGMGAAAGGVVAMAMVRDLFGGYPLVRMLSRLALVSGLAPVLAPVIGSQLLRFIDWRGVFVFLAAYGVVVMLASAFFVVETLPAARRVDPGHSTAGQRYKALFTDRQYLGVALTGAMVFSGLFAYLSSSSFLFQDVYGLDAQQYGYLFGINSIGVVLGVQISSRLQRFIGPQWILVVATTVQFLAAVSMIVLDTADAGLVGVLVPLWFFIASCGFCFPCVQVLALANHGKEAGTAASLIGALNFGVAGLISPIVGLFPIVDAIPMAGVMACAAVVAMTSMWLIVRPKTVAPLER